MTEPLRVYFDTSVFGGCFDDEFKSASIKLFDAVRDRKLLILISETVIKELALAPPPVRELANSMAPEFIETVEIDMQTQELMEAYLSAGILTRRSIDDATHIAAATIACADAIVSWNFKHIVRLDRIKGYNDAN